MRPLLDCDTLLAFNRTALAEKFRELGLPRFRVGQVYRWIFARKANSFDVMTDLSKELRHLLQETFGSLFSSVVETHLRPTSAAADATEKLLLRWPDGECVECVLLRDDRHHRTACISTQVGCAMGCAFCASGMEGFVRNLTRAEILEQVLRLNALLPKEERLTHLVVMGMGEPLFNLDNLLSALDDVTAMEGLDLSVRRVTISTVGLPAKIRRLAESVAATGKGYKLAVSLHAPTDELRTQIIPQNRHTGITAIMQATNHYFEITGRRVTFEYTLIDGVNDAPHHARQLAELLSGQTAIVNLIPLNPVPGKDFRTPKEQTVRQFAQVLKSRGVPVKVRVRKGDSISAACGQLRRSAAAS